MHEKSLPAGSRKLLDHLAKTAAAQFSRWTLAGGTGLALQLGHRISDGFDFFCTGEFDARNLHSLFQSLGAYETLQESPHTLTVIARKTKMSFFCTGDPFICPTVPWRFLKIAHVLDIALMILVAISGRGSRKDFIDLFSILRRGWSLKECLEALPGKYQKSRLNTYHLMKSLTYFEDAESEPPLRMLVPFSWEECKSFFIRETNALLFP